MIGRDFKGAEQAIKHQSVSDRSSLLNVHHATKIEVALLGASLFRYDAASTGPSCPI